MYSLYSYKSTNSYAKRLQRAAAPAPSTRGRERDRGGRARERGEGRGEVVSLWPEGALGGIGGQGVVGVGGRGPDLRQEDRLCSPLFFPGKFRV